MYSKCSTNEQYLYHDYGTCICICISTHICVCLPIDQLSSKQDEGKTKKQSIKDRDPLTLAP